jgi:DNA invertase Pin-like site-specific DNA recombinase
MLTVLGGLAEFERELIRARTGEGRKRAQDRGVRFNRPRKLTPHRRQEALARLRAGETQADIARSYAVDATTIGRLLDCQGVAATRRSSSSKLATRRFVISDTR